MSRVPLALALSTLLACGGGNDDPTDGTSPMDTGSTEPPTEETTEPPPEYVDAIDGPAQKGPFLEGAAVTAQELGSDGAPTGPTVSSTVDAQGTYALSGISWQAPTWVEATGEIFDEIEGEPYDDPFTLNAAVLPLEGRQAAVNLFTDLAAHRIRTLMAGGDAFEAAQTTAISEMTALWGLTSRPEELDLLGGPGSDAEELDLLLYSAASMDEGIDQEDWELVRDDFADDGQLNGDGLEIHEDIVSTLLSDPAELLEIARDNLTANYRAPLVTPTIDGLGFFLNNCLGRRLLRSDRVVCEGFETTFSVGNGATWELEWRPDLPGLHSVVIYQPCSSGNWSFGPTMGGLSSGSFTETTLNTRDLPTQAPIAWSVTSGCDGSAEFGVSPYRISDGSSQTPLELALGERFDGRASNEFFGPERIAHYIVNSPATQVTVSGFNSGTGLNSQNFQVRVYDSVDETTRTLLADEDGTFSATVDIVADKQAYVQVLNQAATPIAYTYASFTITVE